MGPPKETVAEIVRRYTDVQPPQDLMAEMSRLYFDEGLPLQEVAMRVNMSPSTVEREILRQLYIDQGLTVEQVGARLGCSGPQTLALISKYGIQKVPTYADPKYDVLSDLKVGDTVIIDDHNSADYGALYRRARKIGIKFTLQQIGELSARVTRLE